MVLRRLIIALLALTGFCFAQGNNSTVVQIQNNGIPVFTGKKFVPLNCSTGMTCSYSGGAVNMTASGGAALSSISGLVAEYRINDGNTTTLTDSSGNGNNGTFPGGAANPTWLTNNVGLSFAAASHQFITLPTALNACDSYLFGYNYPSIATTTTTENDFIEQATAQAGGTVYSIGFQNTNDTANGNSHKYSTMMTGLNDYSGGNGAYRVVNPGVGTHVLIAVSGNNTAAGDQIYFDGQLETNAFSTASPSTKINNGTSNWQLGGASTFTGWYQGNMYYFACWNRSISSVEAAQANNIVTTALAQRGVYIQYGSRSLATSSTGGDTIVLDGDSIMEGAEDATAGVTSFGQNLVLTSAPVYSIYHSAITGSNLVGTLYPNGWADDNYFNNGASRNVIVENGGHNDTSGDTDIEGATAGFCRDRRKFGWLCGIVTEVSNGGGNATRVAYLRQHWREYSDFLVDWAGDPTIGCNTCNTSFVGPHPNVWESYSFQQYYLQRGINRATGPKDLTSAPTYSAAASAATTVTAASDGAQISTTGQSTATYTFASNPFTVGQLVTCTGITPAGYNTTFMVQTSTSTQITGVIPTFGLAAGSAFGSCSAPQSEDAFALINFGTGNFNIGTACGYTGQRVTIKNINAAASTITASSVPNESAETFDGSATLAIASNQTRVLESILTTPATPQCGWKVIQ